MTKLTKRWVVSSPISTEANQGLENYSPLFRQVLFNRGIANSEDAKEFLNSNNADTTRSDLLGIPEAVERIRSAIKNKEKIIVHGDYDADGVTASSLLSIVINELNGLVDVFIPDRAKDGYGLRIPKLQELYDDGARLIISVDCGIRAIEQAKFSKSIGLDLIITDHHTPGDVLPGALAVINPKRPDDKYPFKELAGVGVAYKLACGLLKSYPNAPIKPEAVLDLVSIGTVADLVPLLGENRALVSQGINRIHTSTRQGLFSLLGISGTQPTEVDTGTIGFSIGPRINAAGRLGSALDSYQLLVSKDPNRAGALAQKLDNINRKRQQETVNIHERAREILGDDVEKEFLIFVAHPEFNPGLVGLAASRLVENFYRPAIVATQNETHTRGSCRSIPEFHITSALEQCADLLDHFGGHAAAAGFTVSNNNLTEFVKRLKKIAQIELAGADLKPVVYADSEAKLNDLTPALIRELTQLQPTGYGNAEPVFITRKVQILNKRTVGKDSSHLKLSLSDGKVVFDAIAFRFGNMMEHLNSYADVAYKFEMNIFNGRRSLQLNIIDIIPN